ncbi:hypothetical protein FBEOM_9620 [Fusarium beomiforme]|uniref:Uncharacterized protein n=1 Tax=Fusarium beomiforme TaxID=44412 RepID=A0A9P5AEL7_9HYPO|nr:hypothetical protein FBEOM_9620 [Fusarium beomiforme]
MTEASRALRERMVELFDTQMKERGDVRVNGVKFTPDRVEISWIEAQKGARDETESERISRHFRNVLEVAVTYVIGLCEEHEQGAVFPEGTDPQVPVLDPESMLMNYFEGYGTDAVWDTVKSVYSDIRSYPIVSAKDVSTREFA